MKLDGAKDAKNNEAEFFREIVILEKGLKTHQKKKKKRKRKRKKNAWKESGSLVMTQNILNKPNCRIF